MLKEMSDEEDIDVVGNYETFISESNLQEEKDLKCHDDKVLEGNRRSWTEKEKQLFSHGMELFGRKWSKISQLIGSRTTLQVKNFAYHLWKKEKKPIKTNCSKSCTSSNFCGSPLSAAESASPISMGTFSPCSSEERVTANYIASEGETRIASDFKSKANAEMLILSSETVKAQSSQDSDQEIVVDDDLNFIASNEKNVASVNSLFTEVYEKRKVKTKQLKDSTVAVSGHLEQRIGHMKHLRTRKKKPAVMLKPAAMKKGGYTMEHDADGHIVKATVSLDYSTKRSRMDPYRLVPCKNYPEDGHAPFKVTMAIDCLLIMDIHAHTLCTEVIGLLGGWYSKETKILQICVAEPCDSLSTKVHCEMDPVSQIAASNSLQQEGYQVVGWYHCHPTFAPCPSVQDLETQMKYQALFKLQTEQPFVAVIISPYFQIPDCQSSNDSSSTFNCMVIDSKSNTCDSKKVPFCFNVSLTTNAVDGLSDTTWTRIDSLLCKVKNHPDKFSLLGKCKGYHEVSYLEKLLLSLKCHMKCAGIKHQYVEDIAEKIKNMLLRDSDIVS